MAKASHEELLKEFRGKILPPNHPLTQAIRDIVTRILEASDLGSLKAEPTFIQQTGTSIEDLWHADVQKSEDPVPGSGGREWRLMVVNDPTVVNAMASFGQRLTICPCWRIPSKSTERRRQVILWFSLVSFLLQKTRMVLLLSSDTVCLLGSVQFGSMLTREAEIAHVVARHVAERYSSMKVFLAFATLLEVLGLDYGIARLLTTFLLDLPNSRKQELEGSQVSLVYTWKFLTTCLADVIGLRLSAKACYNPEAAPA